MSTFLLTLLVFLLVALAMAAGLLLGGRRLRGSCGLTAEDCHCSVMERWRCEQR